MTLFNELAASRKEWIEHVLKPWCQKACLSDLKKAEAEWNDLAGRVDPDATLWTWAWSRFPALVCDGLSGVNETDEVCVTLNDGRNVIGFPDAKVTKAGKLVLLLSSHVESKLCEPISIDEIMSVAKSQ